jgi:hypothetical protein
MRLSKTREKSENKTSFRLLSLLPKYALMVLAISLSFASNAQNAKGDRIQWNATSFIDVGSNEKVQSACTFVTMPDKILWSQDGGKYEVAYAITSTIGTWTNVNSDGSIQYSILDKQTNVNGELKIRKETEGWSIELKLPGGSSDINLKYAVSSIEKL